MLHYYQNINEDELIVHEKLLVLVVLDNLNNKLTRARASIIAALDAKLKLKLFTTCAGKQDRLMSLGPFYFAIYDLSTSWAPVSSTTYIYRHT
jgi:hypothetical protein